MSPSSLFQDGFPDRFRDREDAGRRLAAKLKAYASESPLVIGLPRGGVPVAFEVARALDAPLDVWVVRKLGAPIQPELGMGAIAEGGQVFLDPETVALVGASEAQVQAILATKSAEVLDRCQRFRRGASAPDVRGRTVIVVDDGVATGGTVRAALRAIRKGKPKRIVLGVPVASPEVLESLAADADEIVCLSVDPSFLAIGESYEDFTQTSDDEVIALLDRARTRTTSALERTVRIPLHDAVLQGDLAIPRGASAIVLFAHGSGSSRKSARNRFVATALRRAGLATLLFDLLTEPEEALDELDGHLRFDIALLAERLAGATDWVRGLAEARSLRIGYFGASTGAAAALVAAAKPSSVVGAIVSRGGRPDLAGPTLARVKAPTLLIVGGYDFEVLELNRNAMKQLAAPTELKIVPRATHLFEEPGALDQVATLASDWFVRQLMPARVEARP